MLGIQQITVYNTLIIQVRICEIFTVKSCSLIFYNSIINSFILKEHVLSMSFRRFILTIKKATAHCIWSGDNMFTELRGVKNTLYKNEQHYSLLIEDC